MDAGFSISDATGEDCEEEKRLRKFSRSFHGVYLLISEAESKRFRGRAYVGYTVDPKRRIQQHNAGCKKGGAKKTSDKGPWSMILIVHGFPSEIAGLRFEWAWQNPDKSRRLKPLKLVKKAKESQYDFKLRILSNMLETAPWQRLSLTVQWLDMNYYKAFTPSSKDSHFRTAIGPIVHNPDNCGTAEGLDEDLNCAICDGSFKDKERCIWCPVADCSRFHVLCLANRFLEASGADYLIPIKGTCPKCSHEMIWTDVVHQVFHAL